MWKEKRRRKSMSYGQLDTNWGSEKRGMNMRQYSGLFVEIENLEGEKLFGDAGCSSGRCHGS
jgi:hypothetical protein